MRRALLRSWPALTRFYQILPRDVADFTMEELNEYLAQYEAYRTEQAREQSRAASRARGRR